MAISKMPVKQQLRDWMTEEQTTAIVGTTDWPCTLHLLFFIWYTTSVVWVAMDNGRAMRIYNEHTKYNSSHIATAVEFACDYQISWQQYLNQLKKNNNKQLASTSQDRLSNQLTTRDWNGRGCSISTHCSIAAMQNTSQWDMIEWGLLWW